MNAITYVLVGLLCFFGLLFLSHGDNPCSQFGMNQELCRGSV